MMQIEDGDVQGIHFIYPTFEFAAIFSDATEFYVTLRHIST